MYFCILFGVLVVSGIFVGIGIHFARLPNRNSGEMNIPTEETQKEPKTGELKTKKVCNGGVTCSLLKLGSLEKTVIGSLFHSGVHSGTIFLWKKQCHMLFWGTTGYALF